MPRRQSPASKRTVKRVMHEYKHGSLESGGSGKQVKNPKQAVAIALSEAGVSKKKTPGQNKKAARKSVKKLPTKAKKKGRK